MLVRHIVGFQFICFLMDWRLIVPAETGFEEAGLSAAREVRLRPGQPVAAVTPHGVWQGSHVLSAAEVNQAAQALSGYSLAAHREELSQGFLPLPGGHRLGVCGVSGARGSLEITSLCVRVAHEVKDAGKALFPRIRGRHTLIIGPPGAGKTTLLRDLVRLYSLSGIPVGVVDERGEIAACREGRPQLDVGPFTDVASGQEKAKCILQLIRSMAPQVIATDEIGGTEDAQALAEALRCGVTVLATAHGRNMRDVEKRPGLAALCASNAFEAWIQLQGPDQPPQVFFRSAEEE